VKVQAYMIERTEYRKLDKQSRKDIKKLNLTKDKLPPILWSFSAYTKYFNNKFHKKADYEDDYLKALTHKYSELSRLASKNQALKEQMMPYVKINILKGNECKYYRLGKLSVKFKFKFACDESHIESCEDCQDWLANYNSGVMFEGDKSTVDLIEEAENKHLGKIIDVDLESSIRKNEPLNEFLKQGKNEGLPSQYPKPTTNYDEGFNLWHDSQAEQPKPKSNQQQLKDLFPNSE
jgi:hypothetical protein